MTFITNYYIVHQAETLLHILCGKNRKEVLMSISVTRRITQVQNGEEYSVRLTFGDDDSSTIEFNVRFTIPIGDLDEKVGCLESMEKCRQIIVFATKTISGEDMIITDAVFTCLLDMLAEPVTNAYLHPMMKGANEGDMKKLLSGEYCKSILPVVVSIENRFSYSHLPPVMLVFFADAGIKIPS